MVSVERLYSESKRQSPALRRIQLLSLPFEIVFALLAALVAALILAVLGLGLFGAGEILRVSPEGAWLALGGPPWPEHSIAVADLPLSSRLAGALALVCIQGSLLAGLVCLNRLFNAYRRGVVFARNSMSWMRRAGFFLIAFALTPLLFQPLVQSAGLLDRNWFHGHTVAALLVGAALFVLAHIIALGRELEKEGEGYV